MRRTDDATFLDGEVANVVEDRHSGQGVAVVRAAMTNQDGEVMATGQAEILLPAP